MRKSPQIFLLARSKSGGRRIGLALLGFVLLLTFLLSLSGGPSNPFTILFLVPITASIVALDKVWSWSLAAISVLGFSFLFIVPGIDHAHHAGHFESHLQGMLIAFAVTTALTCWLVGALARGFRQTELELSKAEYEKQRLSGLTTLAAGAAHELSTPLSTIAVISKELELRLSGSDGNSDSDSRNLRDLSIVREEVDRCRQIIEQMGPETEGDIDLAVKEIKVSLLKEQLEHSLEARGDKVNIRWHTSADTLHLPIYAINKILENLVFNAVDAADTEANVEISLSQDRVQSVLRVSDRGSGIPKEHQEKILEPFFTTKAPGRGMGLGLFIVKLLVNRLSGTITVDSSPKKGTVFIIVLPRQDLEKNFGRSFRQVKIEQEDVRKRKITAVG